MHLKLTSSLAIILLAFTQASTAITPFTLAEKREQVIQRYISDLGKADDQDIVKLFEKEAIVISTSKGEANAQSFFHAFLPTVVTANTQLNQYFINKSNVNRSAARFHLSFTLKDGEKASGNYVDEFLFTTNSAKLSAIYTFENLKLGKFA